MFFFSRFRGQVFFFKYFFSNWYYTTFSKKKFFFCTRKHEKTVLIIGPNFFFQNCQSVKNQPKSHFLFQKNVFLRALYIMTLIVCNLSKQFNIRWNKTMSGDFSTPMYVNEKKILLLVWEMRTSSGVEVKSLDSTSYACVILQTAWCWPKKKSRNFLE